MTSPRVLVIGEALIDIVETDAGSAEHVGGSPLNVAVGVARLGLPVRLATRVGRDARGERIAAHVAAAGAELTPQSWTDEPTDTARARIQPSGAAEYDFAVAGRIEPGFDPDVALVHSGSIGLFLAPGADVAVAALEAAQGRALVTVDPNIRPALVGDRDAARRQFARAAAAADLVKLSDEDAEWLWPGASVDEVLATIAAYGPRVVVITRGGDGATGRAADGAVVAVPGVTVAVVDTIGAGDSFMASLIRTALEDGVPENAAQLEAALRLAARTAAITVSRAGADPPTRADLED